jgi:hypothetical protein
MAVVAAFYQISDQRPRWREENRHGATHVQVGLGASPEPKRRILETMLICRHTVYPVHLNVGTSGLGHFKAAWFVTWIPDTHALC